MPAGVFDWHVEQGVSSSIDIEYKDPVSNPQPLGEFTPRGQVRLELSDRDYVAELVLEVTDAPNGELKATLPASALAGKLLKGATAYNDKVKAHYDIRLDHNTDPDKSVRLLNGFMYISPEVTR